MLLIQKMCKAMLMLLYEKIRHQPCIFSFTLLLSQHDLNLWALPNNMSAVLIKVSSSSHWRDLMALLHSLYSVVCIAFLN